MYTCLLLSKLAPLTQRKSASLTWKKLGFQNSQGVQTKYQKMATMQDVSASLSALNAAVDSMNSLSVDAASFGVSPSNPDNADALEAALNYSNSSHKTITLGPGVYRISRPIKCLSFSDAEGTYKQFSFQLVGSSLLGDRGDRAVIECQFSDGPALALQQNKGSRIQGIYFRGRWQRPDSPYYYNYPQEYVDPHSRDSRFSPHTAIAIDAFCYTVPPDGGYPNLTQWYKGPYTTSGSTGIFIKDCTFDSFTVGAITSPNGVTQNAELVFFENTRIVNCKVGFAGCQDQEKMNKIVNTMAWGTTHTLFCFNVYGAQKPGQWFIDGVNIAGEVFQMVYRWSTGWYPLMINNVFAESMMRIGTWGTSLSDTLSSFTIDFHYPDQVNTFPMSNIDGGGVSFRDGLMRYYGTNHAIFLKGGSVWQELGYPMYNVKTTEALGVPPNLIRGYYAVCPDNCNQHNLQSVPITRDANGIIHVPMPHPDAAVGKYAVIINDPDIDPLAFGQIDSISDTGFTIKWVNRGLIVDRLFRIAILNAPARPMPVRAQSCEPNIPRFGPQVFPDYNK